MAMVTCFSGVSTGDRIRADAFTGSCNVHRRRGAEPIRKHRLRVRAMGSNNAARNYTLKDFHARRAFKVIAGLNNFDPEIVSAVVVAADKGGATHVDIACDAELVKLALGLTSIPICVSAVEPERFIEAVRAGAHMIEIGNYDSYYESGRIFSAKEVVELTKRTRSLFPHITLSVTVPHTLLLDEQVELAETLVKEGADIIQTEGGTSSSPSKPGVTGLIEKAVPTLSAVYSISRAVVNIPVMCASGLSSVTAPMAISLGAAGVGIGSAINKLNDEIAMIAAVKNISDALNHSPVTNFEIANVANYRL